VGGLSHERAFTLVTDPRVSASPEEISTWTERVNETAALLDTVLRRLGEARKARGQIEALMEDYAEDKELQQAGAAAVAAIQAWDAQLVQPLHQTYEDEDAWETMLAGQIRYLMDVIDGTGAPVTDGAMQRLADLKAEWAKRQAELEAITAGKIAPINNWARDKGVAHVAAPGQ
jgi:phosphoserine phosphatase